MRFLCVWIPVRKGRTRPLLDMISRWQSFLDLVSLELSLSFIDDAVRERQSPTGRLLTVENHT